MEIPRFDLNDPKINPELQRIHVASHSTRIHILNCLNNGDSYAAKLGQELNVERKVIAFHLMELEKVGLVEGKYSLNQDKRPVAVKSYQLTRKGRDILQIVLSMIKK